MDCNNCGHKIARDGHPYKYLHADRFYENEEEDKALTCQKDKCNCQNPEKELTIKEWEKHHQEVKERIARKKEIA
jgi:hypothetical protein